MKNSALLIAGFFFINCGQFIAAQSPSQAVLNEIAGDLVKNYSNQAGEYLYVHTDKPLYKAGSTIWFRAYLLDQYTNHVSSLSKLVYIDLINEKDSIVDYVILNAGEQGMEGGINIPLFLPEGNYRLRAYSHKILNNQPGNIFISPLYIINSSTTDRLKLTASRNSRSGSDKMDPVIRFYPEGGNIISGINNIVAFSAHDIHGNLVPVSGRLKDDRDSVVAVFHSSTGLGKFMFFPPSRARKYTAFVTGKNLEQAYRLPRLSAMAYQLSVIEQNNDLIKFRVSLGDSVYNKKTISYLLGTAAGTVCFASIGQGMYEIIIPRKDLPGGVVTFHLFNEQKQLVSVRKVYNEKREFVVDISTNKNNYISRDLVRMTMSVKDTTGKPLPALLSVSVTDNRYIQWPQHHETIESFALQHQYPFKTPVNRITQLNSETKDLLMLVHNGNFTSNTSISTKSTLPSDSNGLSIRGKIFNKNNEPVENQVVTLFSNQYRHIVFADTTDNKGAFNFTGLDFYDSTRFIIQVSNLKGIKQDLAIVLDPPVFPDPGIFSSNVTTPDPSFQLVIDKFRQDGMDSSVSGQTRYWLQEIATNANLKKNKNTDRNRNSFTRMVTREQLSKIGLSNTANAVMMVPGVLMLNGRLTLRGGMPTVAIAADLEPIVIVDGVQAATGGSVVNYLNTIPPDLIESIEVLAGPEAAQYATRGANGVIIIKTGQPDFDPKNQKQMGSFYPRGYHISPGFYMAPYEIDQVREANFHDNRSTIYWNGELLTNNEGKVSVSFYTADQPATYTVTVQGVTSKGNIIYETYSIKRGM